MKMAEETKPTEPAKEITADDLKKMAEEYAVPMSDGTFAKLTENLTPEKIQAFEEYVKNAAMGLYPTFAKQIKAGIPTKALLEPYRQVGKQVLGEDFEPDFVGDPKSADALQGATDPETGRATPMSLNQWRTHLMTHKGFGWDKTPAANEKIQQVLQALDHGFNNPPQQGAM
jgi:hypothetical protein